jgi:hypothetical protein
LQARIDYLEAELQVKKPTGRKTVKINPQETFASIEAIHQARVEAEAQAQAWVARHGDLSHMEGRVAADEEFHSLCGSFHL